MGTEYLPYFEVKDVGEDGTFRGVASVAGVEDLGGDIVTKGAFKKTISENATIPILWQHKADEVIGEGRVSEWQGKLLLDAKLDMEDPTAQKAHRKLKSKLVKGLSIGFSAIKSTYGEVEGRLVRNLEEIKLWEVSIVTFPMLPTAQVTSVKSDDRIAELERQIQALQAKQSGTPPGEPPPAKEPPPPAEPVVDHSKAIAAVEKLQKELNQWKSK